MGRVGAIAMATVMLTAGLSPAGRAQSAAGRAQSSAGISQTMPEAMPAKKAVVAEKLTVSAEGKTRTFTLQDLEGMLQRTVTVHNGHSQQDEVYSGVGLDELLKQFGLTMEGSGSQKIFHSYVRAEGSDHYFVVYSAAELEPAIHTGDSIVALTRNGKPLGEEGQFKLVVAGEKKPARWVRNLTLLKVVAID